MFKSSQSKAQSASLINKLTASVSTVEPTNKSTTELLNDQFKPKTKKVIKKQNKTLLKKSQQHAKELKRVKYELIKAKKESGTLSVEHEKYLKKLAKKNKNLLLKGSEIEDLEYDARAIQDEILNFGKKQQKKKNQFKTKIKTGLTPGLAPVSYDSEDDE